MDEQFLTRPTSDEDRPRFPAQPILILSPYYHSKDKLPYAIRHTHTDKGETMREQPIRYRILGLITAQPTSIATLSSLVDKSESTVRASLNQLKKEGVKAERNWYGETKEYRYSLQKGTE
jgi:biotin operon repressor